MSNQVTLIGRIISGFIYDHSLYGEKFFRVTLAVSRTSGALDNIPVIISERLITDRNYNGVTVCIRGQFRSFISHEEGKNKLLLYVFALRFEEVKLGDLNDIFLEGTINRPPTFRLTPLGREISDIILAVPREYGKSDYIPCVCWGRTAKYMSGLCTGQTIRVAGRIQSREYQKNNETKTAYEVSIYLMEVV